MKATMATLTKTTTPNVEVDMSKLQSKKGLNINDEGSSSSTFKPDATSESKGKGIFFSNGAYKQRRQRNFKILRLKE